jgi:hypothetical protein
MTTEVVTTIMFVDRGISTAGYSLELPFMAVFFIFHPDVWRSSIAAWAKKPERVSPCSLA